MFQPGPFSIPHEVFLSGVWFGLSAIFLMLGHHLWKYRLESPLHLSGVRFWKRAFWSSRYRSGSRFWSRAFWSSLLVGMGGFTLILFLYSAGFLVAPGPDGQEPPAVRANALKDDDEEAPRTTGSNLGGQKTEAGTAQETTDPNLFIAIIAVVITLFTGAAMNMVFDLRKEWQEEGQKHATARAELQMDTLRLRQQLEMLTKANELTAGWRRGGDDEHGWEPMIYRYLILLFSDPRKVSRPRDLGLDLLRDLPDMRAVLTDENWEYIRWLAASFSSDLPGVQSQIRSLAEGLYVSYRQEKGP